MKLWLSNETHNLQVHDNNTIRIKIYVRFDDLFSFKYPSSAGQEKGQKLQ